MGKENLPEPIKGGGLMAVGEKIWDAETKQHVTLLEEDILRYVAMRNQLTVGEILRCESLFQIRSRRLYLCTGAHGFAQWCEEIAGMPARTGHCLAERGEKMFLFLNAAGNAGLPAGALREALIEGPKQTRLFLLQMPPDEAVDKLKEQTWVSPDGQELTAAEVIKKIGGDREEKFKAVSKRAKDLEADLETAKAELEEYRRVQSGETTVAQEMAARVEKLTGEVEKLRGQRQRGEELAKQMTRAREGLEFALGQIKTYAPHKPEDWENPDWVEVMVELHSLAAKYYMELQHWCDYYAASRKEFEG